MNFDFLKNIDKRIIILAVALLILILVSALKPTLSNIKKKNSTQTDLGYKVISISSQPTLKKVNFSNIKINQYNETNADITATITNKTSSTTDAFTISITKGKSSATALVPSLAGYTSSTFSTNVSIDFTGVTKIRTDAKNLELRFE